MPGARLDDCLTDEELTSLLQGVDPGERRDEFMRHLDGCPGCRMVLAEATRHVGARPLAKPRSWYRALAIVAAILLAVLALSLLR